MPGSIPAGPVEVADDLDRREQLDARPLREVRQPEPIADADLEADGEQPLAVAGRHGLGRRAEDLDRHARGPLEPDDLDLGRQRRRLDGLGRRVDRRRPCPGGPATTGGSPRRLPTAEAGAGVVASAAARPGPGRRDGRQRQAQRRGEARGRAVVGVRILRGSCAWNPDMGLERTCAAHWVGWAPAHHRLKSRMIGRCPPYGDAPADRRIARSTGAKADRRGRDRLSCPGRARAAGARSAGSTARAAAGSAARPPHRGRAPGPERRRAAARPGGGGSRAAGTTAAGRGGGRRRDDGRGRARRDAVPGAGAAGHGVTTGAAAVVGTTHRLAVDRDAVDRGRGGDDRADRRC